MPKFPYDEATCKLILEGLHSPTQKAAIIAAAEVLGGTNHEIQQTVGDITLYMPHLFIKYLPEHILTEILKATEHYNTTPTMELD